MAEREGFEPSMGVSPYSLSRGAPSAARPSLQCSILATLCNRTGLRPVKGARYSKPTGLRPRGTPICSIKITPNEFCEPLGHLPAMLRPTTNRLGSARVQDTHAALCIVGHFHRAPSRSPSQIHPPCESGNYPARHKAAGYEKNGTHVNPHALEPNHSERSLSPPDADFSCCSRWIRS